MVRLALPSDARDLARLHAERITEGFLPSLGESFLRRLYGRVAVSDHAFAHVVDDHGRVLGFSATATSVRALYRQFVLRDGFMAALGSVGPLARNLRRVRETLRYPASDAQLPAAEILAVAVDAGSAGQGHGRRLVVAALDELVRRGVPAAKVVAGAENAAAIALYETCGFAREATVEVHAGVRSEVLVWRSSPAC